ncbi:MAG: M28 family peptidase [Alkalilacustris sp.]
MATSHQPITDTRAHRIMSDLHRICDFGGRLSGTESEKAAIDWLRGAAAEALGTDCVAHEFPYMGWRATRTRLLLPDGQPLDCHPLVRSVATPPEGLSAEVVDLGRGLEEDFTRHRAMLPGRIALFRHEVMFSADTFHRRRKLGLARDHGAIGALVASTIPGEVVTGSSRGEGDDGIPTMGITPEAATSVTAGGGCRVRMILHAEESPATGTNLLLDLPGQGDGTVVLSAHIDGHDLGESALDNASGVATCLEVARRVRATAPHRHSLRLAFFSVEEWGLTGSDRYLATLSDADRERILLNVNLDTVAGGARLTALTSGFPRLSGFLRDQAGRAGFALNIHEPLQKNSDHANFAARGIPAFRLLAGFDAPREDVRLVLTRRDRRDRAGRDQMIRAADVATALTLSALNVEADTARTWRRTALP